jgi:hypothetical protein
LNDEATGAERLDAYIEGLLDGGPYKRHFSDDVVLSIVGTDQGAEGPDATEDWIDYLHAEARAKPVRSYRIWALAMAKGWASSISSAST